MNHLLAFLLTLSAGLPGPALAQTGNGSADVQQDHQEAKQDVKDERSNKEKLRELSSSVKNAVMELDARQEAAAAPIRDDPKISAMEKKEKLANLRGDYDAQRAALKRKYSGERKNIEKDIRRDRVEARQARREAHQDRRERHEKR